MKPTIECVMIVKNESEVLDRCLQSVRDADKITIVDTGSEDNTIEIAKKYTPNVYNDFTWCDSFQKARNHALSKATCDWVLSIDADEWCHDFSKVRESVEKAHEKGYLALDVALFAKNNGQLHYFPRLFKRDPAVWWEGDVHNHVSVRPDDTSTVEITYGYSPAHLKDPNRAMRILQKVVDETQNPREMFYLGREFWYRRWYEQCVQMLGRYVQKSGYLAEKADAFLIMAQCYWALGMGNDARDACAQCLVINANFKDAILFMAQIAGDGSGNAEWQANADQWKRMAATATNERVLFASTQ